jgi:hypothetical protein
MGASPTAAWEAIGRVNQRRTAGAGLAAGSAVRGSESDRSVPLTRADPGQPYKARGSPATYLTIGTATLATALGTTLATTRRVLATGDHRSPGSEASRDDYSE